MGEVSEHRRSPDIAGRPPGPIAWTFIAWALLLAFSVIAPGQLNSGRWAWAVDGDARIEHVQNAVELHDTRPAFQKRVLTRSLVSGLDAVLGNLWWSFVVVEFVLLLAAALVLVGIGRELGLTRSESVLSQLLFFTSPTILFAHFPPVFSFDEAVHMLALFLLILCTLRRLRWAVAPALFFALVARETTLLLVPAFVVFASVLRRRLDVSYLLSALVAIAAYLGIMSATGHTLLDSGSTNFLHLNFGTRRAAVETTFNLFISLGIPGLVALLYWRRRPRPTGVDRAFLAAFAVALLVNHPVVCFAAVAAEMRLLALPLVFVWPLAGRWLARLIPSLAPLRAAVRSWSSLGVLVASALVVTQYMPAYLTLMYQLHAAALLVAWTLVIRAAKRYR